MKSRTGRKGRRRGGGEFRAAVTSPLDPTSREDKALGRRKRMRVPSHARREAERSVRGGGSGRTTRDEWWETGKRGG
jgi:hypothetical protein